MNFHGIGSVIVGFVFFLIAGSVEANPPPVRKHERALIAVVNLSIRSYQYQNLYRREENRAVMKIRRDLAEDYGRVAIFEKWNATRQNFMQALYAAEADPSIRAIDVIIYLHGSTGSIGFVDGYYSSARLRDDILRLESTIGVLTGNGPKLRALYSDACYGASHLEDWIRAGFRIASGAVGQDSNWSLDLHKWMVGWRKGKQFARGIRRANRIWITHLTDWYIDGDSHKVMEGDSTTTIETPVER